MRKLILLLALSQWVMAQPRENKPLPVFTKKPVKVLDDDIVGWSFSLDGQWISEEMKIPVRLISTNEDQYKTKVNELGNDNIEELQLYPIMYGSDTLVMLVKLYEEGRFEFQRTQQGWDDYLNAYYFILDHRELDKLNKIGSETAILELPMRDFGRVADTRKNSVLEDIQQKVIIKPKTDRLLAITARRVPDTDKIQFQIASMHDIFVDVEGVLNDFQLNGKSVYGNKALLDYLYYETDYSAFMDFFKLPAEIKFPKK